MNKGKAADFEPLAWFGIEGEVVARGYDLGGSWNGWARPKFPARELVQVLQSDIIQGMALIGAEVVNVAECGEHYKDSACGFDCPSRDRYPVDKDGACELGAGAWIWSRFETCRVCDQAVIYQSDTADNVCLDCADLDHGLTVLETLPAITDLAPTGWSVSHEYPNFVLCVRESDGLNVSFGDVNRGDLSEIFGWNDETGTIAGIISVSFDTPKKIAREFWDQVTKAL